MIYSRDMIVFASSNAMEVAVLGRHPENKVWAFSQLVYGYPVIMVI
jgi:hypothetical protein